MEGSSRLRESPASHAAAFSANAWTAPAARDDAAAAPLPDEATAGEDSQLASDESFEQYVSGKYRFLLEAAGRSPRGSQSLRGELLARERLVVAINTAKQGNDATARATLPEREQQLADQDRRISALLPATDLAAFDTLKDSHIEQFQLDDFAQGISHIAPLAEHEHRAILHSKLANRQRFRQTLEQSGLLGGDLTAPQRQRVLADVTRALREARDGFLQEARQHLGDEEQYTLLANYENGEFAAELEKLRRMAGGG